MVHATALDRHDILPRSGRELLGGYAFLARMIDKVRAEQAGTGGDYVAYCPMTMTVLQNTGVSRSAFDALVREGKSDGEIVAYFDERVSPERKAASNHAILDGLGSHLDAQDAEEGRA